MPRPSDKRVIDETAEYIRQECKLSWVGLAKGGVYAEAPEYARNAMIIESLQDENVTHILPLDADVVPPPDTILRLLKHNKDIIAGVYPLFVNGKRCWSFSRHEPIDKNGKERFLAEVISGNIITSQILAPYREVPKKPYIVNALAGSTVLIKREVFESLSKPWYVTLRADDDHKVLMGHDFVFANRAREAGYDLWVDSTVVCKHYNIVELNSVFNAE